MTEDTPVEKPPEENVVTHARFAGKPAAPSQPFDIEQLRKVGLVTETETQLDDLDLKEPQFGDTICGTLTADEAALYVAYYEAHETWKKIGRDLVGDHLVKVGSEVKKSDADGPVQIGDVTADWTEEQAQTVFRAQRKFESLKAILFWTLTERVGHHDWDISVRTKGRIVTVKRKW